MSGTSADDKLIGFDYQFYYFLLSLLKMQSNDSIGFEVIEDVHIENGEKLILCQLKHTIQTTTHNQPINLTASDIDLWKTLSLWVEIINKQADKNKFIANCKFIFVSNKSDNNDNEFLKNFKTFQNDKNIEAFKTFLTSYKTTIIDKYNKKCDEYKSLSEAEKKNQNKPTQDKKISYLNKITSLDTELLKNFFLNIEFTLNLNEIRQEIKDEIRISKYIKSSFRIEQSFNQIIGLLRDDFYEKVKNKISVQYSREEFSKKVSSIFERMRAEAIPFSSNIEHIREESILNKLFAKQLKDINIKDEDIYEYDYNRVLAITNLKELQQGDEITHQDIDELNSNTIDNWKPIFEEVYIDEIYTEQYAKRVLAKTKQIDLNLAGQKISLRAISNGQFINLSDIPKIGWKYNWKEYEKDE